MPQYLTPQPTTNRRYLSSPRTVAPPPESNEGLSGVLTGAGMLGGAGLIAAGLLARKPGLAAKGLSKLGDIRQQLMLSGLAIPKAVISNVGGAAIKSAERGSMDPLKQLMSRRTIQDFKAAYKTGTPSHAQGTSLHGPGRVLGAIDEAAQGAMGRAGIGAKEAERMTFQTPLNERFGKLGEVLDSPGARYLIPFRRTPFNALYEGLEVLKNPMANPKTLGAIAGAGAVHGAATADERFPASVGLGAAAANKYALPYLLATAAGRAAAGGRQPENIVGEALPISEYGLGTSVTQPFKSFTEPAGYRLAKRYLSPR